MAATGSINSLSEQPESTGSEYNVVVRLPNSGIRHPKTRTFDCARPRNSMLAFLLCVTGSLGLLSANDRPVTVRIFEDLAQGAWLDPQGDPTTEYSESGFAFVRIPAKFSGNALPLDRSVPFSLEASMEQTLERGEYRIRLRSKGLAVFLVDGKPVLRTKAQAPNTAAHDALPEPSESDGVIRPAPPAHQDVLATVPLEAGEHRFRLVAVIGGKGLAPFPGELSVSMARPGEIDRVIGGSDAPLLTDTDWSEFAIASRFRHHRDDIERRRQSDESVEAKWTERHRQVREWTLSQPGPEIPRVDDNEWIQNDVDRFVYEGLAEASLMPNDLVGDLEFLRRLALDATGLVPSATMVRSFLAQPAETRRTLAIEQFLESPDWADSWVPYWQDVLAENPGILKPDLNNTGPFRWYIHQAFADGYSFDRLVVELIEMEGSLYQGGPAGFGMASLNDAPMAAKADIVSQAFLANKLSCARCHDAPFHPFRQKDLFSMAAMLEGDAVVLPASSTVPVREGGRKPYVEITLTAGESIDPHWAFDEFPDAGKLAPPPRNTSVDARHALASMMVHPANHRFSRVVANRVWARFMGRGIVEPLDDWEDAEPSNPELLEFLAREFVLSGYDLKHLSGLIFRSHTYQRRPVPDDPASPGEAAKLFAGPVRRQMSAEQLVDSLHAVAGKGLDSEELNLNPLGNRSLRQFLNMGSPERAWEMTALSNERDRPSLALPRAQAIVDMLSAYGWRQSRQSPASKRDDSPSAMQSLALANGSTGVRVTRLSDDSFFTSLALDERPLGEMVDEVFVRTLTRFPIPAERQAMLDLLGPHFADRVVTADADHRSGDAAEKTDGRVSWGNHFDPESNRIRMEEERKVRMGDPPTTRLTPEFRERFEDMVWALVNTPEFSMIP